ncbi:MAG: DUF4249 family protein [Flavobacteriaceae bacterium]
MNRLLTTFLLLLSGALLSTCIDPVTPEFELEEGLIFVDGFVSTAPGASFVSVEVSAFEFGVYVVNFVAGAEVSFRNTVTNEVVNLEERAEVYVPPEDFVAVPGESWELNIMLQDGRQLLSEPESVLDPIPITNIRASYNPEMEFVEAENDFIPGHLITVDFIDPAQETNNYYWTYKSFENIIVCEKCRFSMLREGECTRGLSGTDPYYDYICETACWQIRYPERINILSDRFIDGNSVRDIEVAQIPLYTIEDIVIEIQQISLTPAAFEYFEVLKDIVDDNRGLNAPPPAALVGNMSNVNDSEDFVFGRFTAAASSTASIFIDRTDIPEAPIETYEPINVEEFGEGPPPLTTQAPCLEGRFRTSEEPETWQN